MGPQDPCRYDRTNPSWKNYRRTVGPVKKWQTEITLAIFDKAQNTKQSFKQEYQRNMRYGSIHCQLFGQWIYPYQVEHILVCIMPYPRSNFTGVWCWKRSDWNPFIWSLGSHYNYEQMHMQYMNYLQHKNSAKCKQIIQENIDYFLFLFNFGCYTIRLWNNHMA